MALQFLPFENLVIEAAPTSPRHAASLASLGVIYAPIVYPTSDEKYVVRDGRGRCLEAISNGESGIICDIRDGGEVEQHMVSLAANVGRRDNPMGNAEDIEYLLGETNPATGLLYTQGDIAVIAGCSQPKVSQLLRLTGLIPEIREMVRRGKNNGGIAPKAGYAAAMLSEEEQRELAGDGPFTIEQVQQLKARHISEMLDLGNTGIERPESDTGESLIIAAPQLRELLETGLLVVNYNDMQLIITTGEN